MTVWSLNPYGNPQNIFKMKNHFLVYRLYKISQWTEFWPVFANPWVNKQLQIFIETSAVYYLPIYQKKMAGFGWEKGDAKSCYHFWSKPAIWLKEINQILLDLCNPPLFFLKSLFLPIVMLEMLFFDEEIMRSFELSLTHDACESYLYQLLWSWGCAEGETDWFLWCYF